MLVRLPAWLYWGLAESIRPIADREGTLAMENLLAATTGRDGTRCNLTAFSEIYRRNTEYPGMSDREMEAVKR